MKLYLTLLLPFLTLSCASFPSSLPRDEDHLVIVKCARLPDSMHWASRFAEHSWVDIKRYDEWKRVEVISRSSGVVIREVEPEDGFADIRWQRTVHVVESFRGKKAKRIAKRVLEVAKDYPYANDYRPWPGPNSNTFVEWLSHQVDGFAFELYPSALGKDYGGWGHIGTTTTRTGIEFEMAALGLQVGLKEGVELHFIGLTLGVGLWPPQLKLPFLPGIPFGLGDAEEADAAAEGVK